MSLILTSRWPEVTRTLPELPPKPHLGFVSPSGLPNWKSSLVALGIIVALVISAPIAGVDGPTLQKGLPMLAEATRGLVTMPEWSAFPSIFKGMVETLEMAIVGTVIAIPFSFLLAILCARNTSIHPWFANLLRVFISVCRAVPFFVWAMLIISMAGLGSLPGVIALVLSSVSYATKLFAESIEVVGRGPAEAIRAVGGGWVELRRFGIIPQAMTDILSQSLYVFEANVRLATAMGIVGAGGIGYELAMAFRNVNYARVLLILFCIFTLVAVVDRFSQIARSHLS